MRREWDVFLTKTIRKDRINFVFEETKGVESL